MLTPLQGPSRSPAGPYRARSPALRAGQGRALRRARLALLLGPGLSPPPPSSYGPASSLGGRIGVSDCLGVEVPFVSLASDRLQVGGRQYPKTSTSQNSPVPLTSYIRDLAVCHYLTLCSEDFAFVACQMLHRWIAFTLRAAPVPAGCQINRAHRTKGTKKRCQTRRAGP